MAEKYLMWDFGKTLSRHGAVWSNSVIEAIRQTHPEKTVSPEKIRPIFAKGFPWHTPEIAHDHIETADQWWSELMQPILNQVFGTLEIPESEFESIMQIARLECLKIKHWTLFEDVIPLLETTSAHGWKHVILSNHVPELEEIVLNLGIRHHFEHVFTSGIVGFEKPHPRIFDFALSKIGAESQIIMIGDNFEHDIEGAARYGIPGILVTKSREWILDGVTKRSLLEFLI
jgi:putative hydrolase of the HAD superfamily